MAEGTVLATMLGATVAISASLPASYDASGYQATGITYTAIGKVESLGEHGGSAQVSSFTPLSDGVTEKFKGAFDYGELALTLGRLPSDSGQDLIDTAFASRNRYSVKLTYPTRTGEKASISARPTACCTSPMRAHSSAGTSVQWSICSTGTTRV